MDISLALSVISVGLSIGSIVYAHRSILTATRGNKIALHTTHRQIYDAMIHFRSLFVEMDLHPVQEEIDEFFRTAVAPAQLYLPSELSERMYQIYRRSWELFHEIDVAESSPDASIDKWAPTLSLQDLGRSTLEQLIRDVGAHIRIVEA